MSERLHTVVTCKNCNGKGKVRDMLKSKDDVIRCPSCKGSGVRT